MALEQFLQEHLCLVICLDVYVQLLIASSSRNPGPGHSLLVSMLVEILLLHCVHFSTTLFTLLLLPLFHVLQHCPELGRSGFVVESKAFVLGTIVGTIVTRWIVAWCQRWCLFKTGPSTKGVWNAPPGWPGALSTRERSLRATYTYMYVALRCEKWKVKAHCNEKVRSTHSTRTPYVLRSPQESKSTSCTYAHVLQVIPFWSLIISDLILQGFFPHISGTGGSKPHALQLLIHKELGHKLCIKVVGNHMP